MSVEQKLFKCSIWRRETTGAVMTSKHMNSKDGTKFDLYSKILIFEPFSTIQFGLKMCSYINEYHSDILLNVLSPIAQNLLDNLLLSDLTMKLTTYNCQTTPRIS